jgi:hypothetical protein
MQPITAAQIRLISDLNFTRLGLTDDAKLQVFVDRAAGYIFSVTGLSYATAESAPLALGPDDSALVVSLIQQAIQMRTEQIILQGRADYIESAAENDVIQSFSAGLYSESRRDPARASKTTSINSWPALNELLWMLMTPERYAWWYSYVTGEAPADFAVVAVDWNTYGGALQWFEPWDTVLPSVETF